MSAINLVVMRVRTSSIVFGEDFGFVDENGKSHVRIDEVRSHHYVHELQVCFVV